MDCVFGYMNATPNKGGPKKKILAEVKVYLMRSQTTEMDSFIPQPWSTLSWELWWMPQQIRPTLDPEGMRSVCQH